MTSSRGSRGSGSSRGSFQSGQQLNIRNVSSFGKYFILEPKFEAIKEESPDDEAGSLTASSGHRANSENVVGSHEVDYDPYTKGKDHYDPDDLDSLMKKADVSFDQKFATSSNHSSLSISPHQSPEGSSLLESLHHYARDSENM